MTPISTNQLDAGDSTPKVARGSLSLAVTAINELYSVIELDADPASMLVSRPLRVTGGVAALGGTPRTVLPGSAVYAGVDAQSHADLSLVDSTGAANNKVARLYTTASGSLNLGFSSDDFSSSTAFLKADRSANLTTLLTLTASALSLVGAVGVIGALTATSVAGDGSALTALNASQLSSGMAPPARLGSGTPSASTFLRGDGTWQVTPTPGVYVLKSGDSMSGALTIGSASVFGAGLEVAASGSSALGSIFRYSADVTGPGLTLIKSRGTTTTAKTSVVSGDSLGQLTFQGMDGSTNVVGVTLGAVVNGTVSPGVIPADFTLSTSGTERVRVASDGKSTFTSSVSGMGAFVTSVTSTAGTTSIDNAQVLSLNNTNISTANGSPSTDGRLLAFGGYSNGSAYVRNPAAGGLSLLVGSFQKVLVTNDSPQGAGTGNTLVQSTVIVNTTASQSALFLQSGAAYSGLKIKAGPTTNANGSTDYWDFTVRPGTGGNVSSLPDQVAMRFENALNATPSVYLQPTAGQVMIGAAALGTSTSKLTVVATSGSPGVYIQGNTTTSTATGDLGITRSGASENFGVGQGASIQLTNTTNNTSVLIQQVSNNLQFFNNTGNGWTERMRLGATGNLSVGTTTANKLLTLGLDSATEGPVMVFRNRIYATSGTRNQGILFDVYRDVSDPSYVAGIWAETTGFPGNYGSLVFGTVQNGTTAFPPERMRIDPYGNVGIGKTPAATLDVNGTIQASGNILPGSTYTNTVSTASVAANTYLVGIAAGILPIGAYHVTVRWDHVASGTPYVVAVAFTMMVVNTNAVGDDMVFTAPVSTHRATDGANFSLRTYANGASTTGLKVALNYAGGDGSFTVHAYRFA